MWWGHTDTTRDCRVTGKKKEEEGEKEVDVESSTGKKARDQERTRRRIRTKGVNYSGKVRAVRIDDEGRVKKRSSSTQHGEWKGREKGVS